MKRSEISTPVARNRRDSGFEATLKDGRRVWVRPVSPQDKEKIQAGLARMSAQSRYMRFHVPVHELSESQLRELTEIDQSRHVAWGAVSLDEPGEPGAGVARYVQSAGDPRSANIAVTVVDEYHGLGLGRLLMQTILVAAATQGIERFLAHVLPENTAAQQLFRALGAGPGSRQGDTLVMEIPVRSAWRTLQASTPRLTPVSQDALDSGILDTVSPMPASPRLS